MKNYKNLWTIIVKGDSYYKDRIKRKTEGIIDTSMHHFVGIYQFSATGTEAEIDEIMNEINYEVEDSDYERGDFQIEDNSIYYRKIEISELLEKYKNEVDFNMIFY